MFLYIFAMGGYIQRIGNNFSLFISDILYKNICFNIEINGVERANITKIRNDIDEFCSLDNKINLKGLFDSIIEDTWIKELVISRNIPDTLEINIIEYTPFVVLIKNSEEKLIDEHGNYIKLNKEEMNKFKDYIKIVDDSNDYRDNIYNIFNLLNSDSYLLSRIKYIYRVENRRWNFYLDNNVIVKMPQDNEIEAFYKLKEILDMEGSEINLKSIDLRNSEKTFLEWK
ncbi:MAG: cell division protein FtsQ/DivIB [Rickettsiales bacterium]|nr:cell division protein FtsQ/DivIB [Rickettsiales bacterium]